MSDKAEQIQALWDPGDANPKQLLFYHATTPYVAYGGAKGGGKTHAVRTKAFGGALLNPGIKILIMRCTYNELEANHIRPMLRWLTPEMGSYNGTTHLMSFFNGPNGSVGSTIQFGHWAGEQSEREYNGQEYDWIFIDEATQFTERAFNFLGGCLRGVNQFQKRMYLTCNPGGVGHNWVKRLFIDKKYKTNQKNPEENENPKDYTFIFATVEDNTQLMESSPGYLKFLSNMPEDIRAAYRYGNWDAIGGNYFKEFTLPTHTMPPFSIPSHWPIYRAFDYGLDMFACGWFAVDEDGRSWCFREYEHKNLIVKDAATEIKNHTLPGEKPLATYAPPDMWSRQKDTGETMAGIFMANGINIVRSDNNRVQGHMVMKDMLSPIPLKDPFVKSLFKKDEVPETLPGLMFFNDLDMILTDIRDIQADENNPNDCAKQPHEVTHTVDMCRYYCINRKISAEEQKEKEDEELDDWDDGEQDYAEYMTGGKLTSSYINY